MSSLGLSNLDLAMPLPLIPPAVINDTPLTDVTNTLGLDSTAPVVDRVWNETHWTTPPRPPVDDGWGSPYWHQQPINQPIINDLPNGIFDPPEIDLLERLNRSLADTDPVRGLDTLNRTLAQISQVRSTIAEFDDDLSSVSGVSERGTPTPVYTEDTQRGEVTLR